MPGWPAGSNTTQIHPVLLDYHTSWARPENVIDLGAAARSARDKRARRKKRTDRSAFTGLCLSTPQRARLGLSLFGLPQSREIEATRSSVRWVSSHARPAHLARFPCITPLWHAINQDKSQDPRGEGSFLHTAWLKSKIYEACPQSLCPAEQLTHTHRADNWNCSKLWWCVSHFCPPPRGDHNL